MSRKGLADEWSSMAASAADCAPWARLQLRAMPQMTVARQAWMAGLADSASVPSRDAICWIPCGPSLVMISSCID